MVSKQTTDGEMLGVLHRPNIAWVLSVRRENFVNREKESEIYRHTLTYTHILVDDRKLTVVDV